MGLNIKNAETYRLAVQLAQLTGETLTRTVTIALKERLEREKRRRNRTGVAEALQQIGRRCASRPRLDDRSPEAILGYNEHGLPR
jgi:antitoxin VapB